MLKDSQLTPYRYARLIEAAGLDFADCTTSEDVAKKLGKLYVASIPGPVMIGDAEGRHALMLPDTFDFPGGDTWAEIHQELLDGPVTGQLDQEKLGNDF